MAFFPSSQFLCACGGRCRENEKANICYCHMSSSYWMGLGGREDESLLLYKLTFCFHTSTSRIGSLTLYPSLCELQRISRKRLHSPSLWTFSIPFTSIIQKWEGHQLMRYDLQVPQNGTLQHHTLSKTFLAILLTSKYVNINRDKYLVALMHLITALNCYI